MVELDPWQRRILAYATRGLSLSEAQINDVYQLFLEGAGLQEQSKRDELTIDVSGRPASVAAKSFRLDGVAELCGINAIPDGSSLQFGPGLTLIYGRNGAGKPDLLV